ncbi:hypothetical protein BKA65DRAFT_589725 [Rhexocercosporidium sp. MPI-PUGE-AT-0058]|nr:hypothetical protein BKA65DRAFT_589725 [Rhexocercosporidium sp. MPI-PUGE-AT-0058]
MPQRSQKPQPLALTPALPSELLTYILTHQTYPTTLIVCQSRASFLPSLQRCMTNSVQPGPPLPMADQEEDAEVGTGNDVQAERQPEIEVEEERQQSQRRPLLIPTLHQIVSSRSINLVFVPTLSHLRAYLTICPGQEGKEGMENRPPKQKQQRQFDNMGNKTPLLVVYGLVAMHRDTSEWSAQGLGCSVAALVEAGGRGERMVVVLEEREGSAVTAGDDDEEGREREGRREGRKTGWEERLPMLNGSVKRVGLESEDGGWSGRTVEVGRVLGRWFRFEKGEWDHQN